MESGDQNTAVQKTISVPAFDSAADLVCVQPEIILHSHMEREQFLLETVHHMLCWLYLATRLLFQKNVESL